jgi:LPS-assembly protein
MIRVRALLLPLVALGGLYAQEAEVLPLPDDIPAVDMITPVPTPEIPIGGPLAGDGDAAPAMPDFVEITNIGGGPIRFNIHTSRVEIDGGVKVVGKDGSGIQGMEIFADRAEVDGKAKRVILTGNVAIYYGDVLQRGDRAVYDDHTKELELDGLRASIDPVLLEAGKFSTGMIGGRRVFVGQDAGVTTHDVEEPNYWLRADETRVYPGEKVTFRNLRVYAGDTPVFWLPYLSQPLDSALGYHFVPGARTNWGPYLLNTYGIMLGGRRNEAGDIEDAWLLSQWKFDIRTRRGFGTGVDLIDTRLKEHPDLGWLSFYYLNDLDPDLRRSGLPRPAVNEDRYRFELKHRADLDLPGDADWYLDTNLTWLSDPYFLEDFDPITYRRNPSPDNTIGVFRRDGRSLVSLFTRLRVNDFYRTDTRLPMLSFDLARGPLLGTPILHEGTASIGVLGVKTGDITRKSVIDPLLALPPGTPGEGALLRQLQGYERQLVQRLRALPPGDPRAAAIRAQLLDSGFTRFHTYQELSLPVTVGGWLNVVPQIGAGHASYWSVDSPVGSDSRTMFHAGTEASLKFSRDWGGYRNWDWGIDGLLHVIQPYANWSLVATDELGTNFPRIDRLTFTTRPRTLSPGRFTAIDSLEDWNIVRLGARNRLLTKRDGQTYEWLYVNTYMDAFLRHPEAGERFSNLYNEIRWDPVPWLGLELETQFPVSSNGAGFSEFAPRIRYLPRPDLELGLGYRFLKSHPVLLDSSRIDFEAFARLSDHWGLGVRHVWELDDATLEVQQYTLHRDLGNWVMGFGITHRDNRIRDELGFVFSLTLKDFPSVSLPFRIDSE